MEHVAEVIARRIETEVLPAILRANSRSASNDRCACAVYSAVVEHAARIAREVGERWNTA